MAITPLPDPPSRTEPSTFATKADAFLGALPAFATEANQLESDVKDDEVAAAASAAAALNYSNIALSSANFIGDWEDQTGAAAPPYAVWHAGNYWQLVSAVLDVAATEPGQTADWRVIGDKIAVPTVADLRLLTGVGTSSAYLVGYSVPEDQGGGPVVWDAASTVADNNVTVFQVTGVVTGRWVRQYENLSVRYANATGDGTDQTTQFQDCIDVFEDVAGARYEIVVPAGDYIIGALTVGDRNIVWKLEAGASVTQGSLPGTVLRPKLSSVSAPISTWVFGETPYTFENVTVTNAGAVAGGASSGTITSTLNGLCSNDRFMVSPRITDFTDGFLAYACDPSGRNTFAVRFWNPTAGNITIGTRTFTVMVGKNSAYRQVFAMSKSQGKDCVFAGVDMRTTKSACIWKTNNAGSSWKPVFALSATGIRDIFTITDNTNSSANDTLDSVLFVPVSDPNTATELAWRSTDGGTTWAAVTFTLSGGTAEAIIYAVDVEGGEGSGGTRMVAGAGRGAADCTVFVSTDSGATFGSPIVVDAAAAYDGCWSVKWISGSGATGVWLAFLHQENTATAPPAVYRSANGGSTWTLLSTVGANGDEWQATCILGDGTILATTTAGGSVYRSTDNGASWSIVFTATTFSAPETKIRVIKQAPNGTVYAAGQAAGYIWISIDNGLTFFRSQRIAGQSAPISMAVTDNWLLFGCGQGLTTSTPSRAEVYRSFVDQWNDSEL